MPRQHITIENNHWFIGATCQASRSVSNRSPSTHGVIFGDEDQFDAIECPTVKDLCEQFGSVGGRQDDATHTCIT